MQTMQMILVLLANTPAQAKFLLHSLEQAAGGTDLYMNTKQSSCALNKMELSSL